MTTWMILSGAILAEVTASLSLQAAVTSPVWFVMVALGYAGAFVGLSLVIRRGLPLGVTYGIWGAAGVALTAILGGVIFNGPLNVALFAGIALVAAGIVVIEMGSSRARADSPTDEATK
jgi:small multidrug resistance pump